MVDTGPLGSDDDVVGAVTGLGASPTDLRWIVLTHCHKDHVGSAAAVAERTGAVVLASAKDAPVIGA